jgi:dolichyl-diphosphooligosaccharide--protein glycosyltransferase
VFAKAAITARWQWIAVGALCLLALGIRVIPRFAAVFQPGFVNFQETDAWYHVRVAENLIRHFPWRITVDPYVIFGTLGDTATSPFYDWLLGLIAWLAGAGAPSQSLLHVIAAWYPAVLGALIVVAVFALAKLVFGAPAALIAATVVATLPGHFLVVSSLGFTDHHVMEALLSTLFLFLMLRAVQQPDSFGPAIAAGLTLAAYLLTFHGSAFLVGIVIAWAAYDRIRSFWPLAESVPSFRPLYVAFLLAAAICFPFRRLLWMNFSLAALLLGCLAIGALDLWANHCRRYARPRLPFLAGLLAATVLSAGLGRWLAPGPLRAVRSIIPYFIPSLFRASRGVAELQSLVFDHGHFTVMPALRQFYGAYLLALLGLLLLAEVALRRPTPGRTLVFFWGFATFVLAMGQVRMTYYFAISVALLSGYVTDNLLNSGRKTMWVTAVCFAMFVLLPNLNAAVKNVEPSGISADWREALDWMRVSTPEPFGDPDFYYARYSRQQFGPSGAYPPGAYSVMAWWDYGYWISAVARRIPVTNPTQANAEVAAKFFLAQSEVEAIPLLQSWRTRFVVADDRLMLLEQGGRLYGGYRAFFEFDRTHRLGDYFLSVAVSDAEGQARLRMFYRPAYYRSMLARLFFFGGQSVDGRAGATILWLRAKQEGGKPYLEVTSLRRFESAEQAMSVAATCGNQGCVLVGENPGISCVPLGALRQLQPVFSSATRMMGSGSSGRPAVQVYEFTETPK